MSGTAAAPAYTTGCVTSRDGTTIGYRELGAGPGVILVHGGMQAAQNFMRLATALADAFTVYVPDRRGRGLSGPPGEHYCLATESDDIDALLGATGTHNVFGLSSGALIALQAALTLPSIRKVALYEPPLSTDHSTPLDWVTRYDQEVSEGKLGSAMVTAIRGTQTAPPVLRFVPRFPLDALMNRATRPGNQVSDARRARGQAGAASQGADVPLRVLIEAMHYDAQLAIESEGTLDSFEGVQAEVLLLGGGQSPHYLKKTLDELGRVLPNSRRVEFPGVGHVAADNSGKPELVARELRAFFAPDE